MIPQLTRSILQFSYRYRKFFRKSNFQFWIKQRIHYSLLQSESDWLKFVYFAHCNILRGEDRIWWNSVVYIKIIALYIWKAALFELTESIHHMKQSNSFKRFFASRKVWMLKRFHFLGFQVWFCYADTSLKFSPEFFTCVTYKPYPLNM